MIVAPVSNENRLNISNTEFINCAANVNKLLSNFEWIRMNMTPLALLICHEKQTNHVLVLANVIRTGPYIDPVKL